MKLALAFRHDVGWDFRYLIARVTGAPVHVAVLFDDECIEATFGGVRRVPTTARLAQGKWTVVPVPASPIDVAAAYRFACLEVGQGYDWLGVVWAWWGGKLAGGAMRNRWFCSELAAGALMVAHIPLSPKRAASYTPRRLWDVVAPWRG